MIVSLVGGRPENFLEGKDEKQREIEYNGENSEYLMLTR